jgi:outer membrane biosynthesis protein TonB
MRRHAGRGATAKNTEAVLSFMSNALKGLSEEIEKLVGEVGKPESPKKVKKPKRRAAPKPKPKPKRKKRAPVRKIVARKPKKLPARAKKAKKLTATAEVLKVIKGHKKGVDVAKLKTKTGFADTKIRAIIFKASKEGKIKRVGRGIYVSA